jgi:carboxylesterase type B
MLSLLHYFALLGVANANLNQGQEPTAKTLNGTYQGRYLPSWDQDAFLGIPYAQPPVSQLRYRWPQSLNSSFEDVRDASSYGYSCMQYSGDWNMSEDCLTLNIIRPAGTDPTALLPVLVWIYGGGLGAGTTADPQYNLSGIVQVSQELGMPIVAASLNYRVSHWGFLQSQEILEEGSSNAGLLDQRLALRWIKENINSFGGDPRRVVLWGESAGAQSITYQMLGYDGRDDRLFHAAILESGGPTGCPLKDLSYWTVPFQNLTRSVGCDLIKDKLACLRNVSEADLYAARQIQEWQSPLIDGDYLTGYPSQLMPHGKFVKVPILTGENTDEGISFNPSYPPKADAPLLETDQDLFNSFMSWRTYALTPPTIRRLLEIYDSNPCVEPPHTITNCSIFPSKGRQWRRAANIGGDLVMIAGRRKMCELFSEPQVNQSVYSYRFDTQLWNRPEIDGVMHFDNVAFSFQNISGLLGPVSMNEEHWQLARAIGRAYVRFAYFSNPNPEDIHDQVGQILPYWPRYSVSQPRNMVLNASRSYIETDTYRKEGISVINSPEVSRELLG